MLQGALFPPGYALMKRDVVILSMDQNESSIRPRICLLVYHLCLTERHTFRGDLTDWLLPLSQHILDRYIYKKNQTNGHTQDENKAYTTFSVAALVYCLVKMNSITESE